MSRQIIDKFAQYAAVTALIDWARAEAGVELRFSRDVHGLEQAHRQIGKSGTGEHFARTHDTLPPQRFFWIGAYSDGAPVATVAARYDEFDGWTLQQFIRHYWARAYAAADGSPAELAENSPAVAGGLTGSFAYLGEAVTRPDFRGRNLSVLMVRLALLSARDEWRPDYAYGYMRDYHAYSGLALKWGFNRIYAGAFTWKVPPAESDWKNLCLVVCDPDGFQSLAADPLSHALFAREKNSSTDTGIRPAS